MAIEIKELIIKASIDNRAPGLEQSSTVSQENLDSLIKCCVEQSVEQVLRELNRKKER